MSWEFLCAWAIFVASCLAQTYHERNIQRGATYASIPALRAVEVSTLIAMVAGLGVIVYYFIVAAWYAPLAMVLAGTVVGSVGLGLASNFLNIALLSHLSFVAWPASIAWAIHIIHGVPVTVA